MEETTPLYQNHWCSATSSRRFTSICCERTTSRLGHRQNKAQLVDRNRFHQMNIEARFLRHSMMLRLSPASQRNQQHCLTLGQCTQGTRGRKTIHRRHAQIQNHHVRCELPRHVERLSAARRLRHLMSQPRKQVREATQGIVVIIGYENTLGHDCPLICPTPRASTFQHQQSLQ